MEGKLLLVHHLENTREYPAKYILGDGSKGTYRWCTDNGGVLYLYTKDATGNIAIKHAYGPAFWLEFWFEEKGPAIPT